MSFCLQKANRRNLHAKTTKRVENIKLLERGFPNIVDILHGNDNLAIEELILSVRSENTQLQTTLCILNMKGSGTEDRSERRRINKTFLKCLVEVMGSRPAALVWLKRHILLETCKTMLSDEKYQGTILKYSIKDVLANN